MAEESHEGPNRQQPSNPSEFTDYSLAQLGGQPVDIGDFLRIAIQCAGLLEDLHSRNQVVRNLTPNAFQIHPRTGVVSLTPGTADYALSAREEHQAARREQVLAYMSPEQTGRMNRIIDARTDLYSLGVIFYELITGQLPFNASDPLEWVHCHIARSPRPPAQSNPTIPLPVSDIVLKLLAKTAEERYQTAEGLQHDLTLCAAKLEQDGGIAPFPLGQADVARRLLMPQKLYGREVEAAVISRAFQQACDGRGQVLLISGEAGIGKTALAHEIYQQVLERSGFFIEGKFESFRHDVPYSAIIQAFKELIRQLLMADKQSLIHWKEKIGTALVSNGQVIIDVIPELELILGKQPAIPALGPDESRNRFMMAFQDLIQALTGPEHPLVLFIDDLHEADPASFRLLETMLTNVDNTSLLFIGSYRDTQLEADHPMSRFIRNQGQYHQNMQKLYLKSLETGQVNQMLSELFGLSQDKTLGLARLVCAKTLGNPLFITQFLKRIQSDGLLRFHPKRAVWDWDLLAIDAAKSTENVIELLASKLDQLEPGLRFLIIRASCIGSRFSLGMLSKVCERTDSETALLLSEAVREELLTTWGLDPGLLGQSGPGSNVHFYFLHDRVRETAYAQLDPEQRKAVHLKIGRLILADLSEASAMDNVFEFIDHLNRGVDLIVNPVERLSLARFNLAAGRKAKASAAYGQAVAYLANGAELLPADCWTGEYELTYQIYKDWSESEYLAGNHERAETLFDSILQNCRTDIERAEIYIIRIILFATIGKFIDNNRLGIEALRLFGYEFPELEDTAAMEAAFRTEYQEYLKNLKDRPIEALLNLPDVTDPEKEVCSKIVMNMLSSAYVSNPVFLALLCSKSINMALRYGISPYSTYSFAVWGLLLGVRMRDYEAGYQFGLLAMKFNEKYGFAATRANTPFVFGNFISHWRRPIGESITYLREAFKAGVEIGDFVYASFAETSLPRVLLSSGQHNLTYVLQETEDTLSFFRRIKNDASLERQELILHAVLNLMGQTERPDSLSLNSFDEHVHIEKMKAIRYGTGIALYYYYKMMTLYLHGFFEEALRMGDEAMQALPFIANSTQEPDCVYFHALCLLACYETGSDEQRMRVRETLAGHLQKMAVWAENAAANYQDRYLLLLAEMARIEGDLTDAGNLYEKAIQTARENGFSHTEAIGWELASRYYRGRGFDEIADTYLRRARACYLRWGAEGKVKCLDLADPWLGAEARASSARAAGAESLDLMSVLKAAQALSSEIQLSRLMETLLRIAAENAGAQTGALILIREGQPLVFATVRLEGGDLIITTLPGDPLNPEELPEGVINYVSRTREKVLLDNAADPSMFSSDRYIRSHRPRSVLCLPIVRQSELAGMLYLENNLIEAAFTPDKQGALEIIAGQAAVSLENAWLYEDLQASEQKFRAVFEQTFQLLGMLSLDGLVVEANQTALQSYGLTGADVVGRPFWQTVWWTHSAEAQETLKSAIHQAAQGELVRFETTHMLPDGGLRHIDFSLKPVLDRSNQPLMLIAEGRDITERKHAEAELAASQQKFSQAFRCSVDAVGILRLSDQRYMDASDAFFSRMGYLPEEVIGHRSDEFGLWWDMEARKDFYHRIKTVGLIRDLEIILRTKAGEPRTGLLSAEVMDILGEDCILYVWHDITERKQAEEALRQARDELEIKVQERTCDLTSVNEELTAMNEELSETLDQLRSMQVQLIQSEKLAALGSMVAGLAHEINTPIGLSLTAASNLNGVTRSFAALYEAGDASAEDLLEYLEDCRMAGSILCTNLDRAAKLVRSFKQVSIDQSSDARRTFGVKQYLDEILLSLHPKLKKTKHTVTVECDESLLIDGYPGPFAQVITNLVMNSLVHGYDENDAGQIHIKVDEIDDKMRLVYTDDGKGIAPEIMPRVFDPFFTTKRGQGATGLGLAILHNIVVIQMNGKVECSSEPGKGTTFNMEVPVKNPGMTIMSARKAEREEA